MKKKRKTREWIKWATHEALKVKLRKAEDSNARLNEAIRLLERDGQSAAETIETLRVRVGELTWERNGLRVEVNRETRDRQLAMDLARMVAEALGPKKAEGK